MIPIQDIINKKIIEARESRDREVKHWHCSKLGQCLRGVYFERLGVKPDKEFTERELRVFDVGKMFENWIIGLIDKQEGVEMETQVKVLDEELDISGMADLVISYDKTKKVYELKSKHSRAFWYMADKKEGANRQHEYQLWTYLKLLGVEEGSILYVSKDDLAMMEFPVLLSDKKLEEEVMNEVNLLNRAWKEKDPSILPLPNGKSWKSKWCRYHSNCLKVGTKPSSYLRKCVVCGKSFGTDHREKILCGEWECLEEHARRKTSEYRRIHRSAKRK